jgi:hypothetical protein
VRIRRPVIYTAVSAAAIATAGLLASPATASTTQFPYQEQGISLYNNYGSARGTVTADQYGQYGQYGQSGQSGKSGKSGQGNRGSVTVSGTVSDYRSGRYGNRQGTIEEVFLSSNSWQRGTLIGSAGPGQSGQFRGTAYNTDSVTITLCTANKSGGNVRDCTSQSIKVSAQQQNPGNH